MKKRYLLLLPLLSSLALTGCGGEKKEYTPWSTQYERGVYHYYAEWKLGVDENVRDGESRYVQTHYQYAIKYKNELEFFKAIFPDGDAARFNGFRFRYQDKVFAFDEETFQFMRMADYINQTRTGIDKYYQEGGSGYDIYVGIYFAIYVDYK